MLQSSHKTKGIREEKSHMKQVSYAAEIRNRAGTVQSELSGHYLVESSIFFQLITDLGGGCYFVFLLLSLFSHECGLCGAKPAPFAAGTVKGVVCL